MLLWDNVGDTNKMQYIILKIIITIVEQIHNIYTVHNRPTILGLGLELLIFDIPQTTTGQQISRKINYA